MTDGFKKELDIVGVGYRAEVKGKQVVFALGYSHPIVFDVPAGIDVTVEKQTHITVTGIDRQLVGQVAANIRRMREPDPVQAEGRALHGRTAEEEGRKDGSLSVMKIRTKKDRRERIRLRQRKRIYGHGRAAAAGGVPVGGAHLRAGHRRPRRPHGGVGRRAPSRG